MTLVSDAENTSAQRPEVQLTLSWSEAQELRVTLPGLLQALTDRPTAPPRVRERRQKAHSILERLQAVLSGGLQQVQEHRDSQD